MPETIESNDEAIKKPAILFKTITFSDGSTLTLEDDEIVVFVGPNNAGKSATLKELQNWIGYSKSQKIASHVTFNKVGTVNDFRRYLESFALKVGDLGQFSYAGIGFNINHQHLGFFDQPETRHVIAPFFSSRLATETRITDSNPAGPIRLYYEAPSHPIHLLMSDNNQQIR